MAGQAAEQQQQQQQQQPQQPQTPQEPQEVAERPPWLGTTAEHCREMVDRATSRNPTVKFMIQKMEEVGAPLLSEPD